MGLRGPPPTPTPILKSRGSWLAKRRKKQGELEPDVATRANCPEWLDEEAKKCWRSLAKRLMASRILSENEFNALARYCVLWSHWRKDVEFLEKFGRYRIVKDEAGNVAGVEHFPQVASSIKLNTALIILEREFGLTPSARTRILIEKPRPYDDPAEKYLNDHIKPFKDRTFAV